MGNPLVAEAKDSTESYSGISLLESAHDLKSAIESGDWASVAMGSVGTALDALSMAMDPFGAILAAGVGWLMEHVGPLKDALNALAGNPDEITAQSETWKNIAAELGEIGQDLAAMSVNDTVSWTGVAADAYRRRAADTVALLASAQEGSAGAASGVKTAGEVVAAVRALVRDIIAELVGHLISWALQVAFTLGVGLTWVVPQVIAEVAKTAAHIADLVKRLIQALQALVPLIKRAGDLFGDATKAMRSIKSGGTTPTAKFGALPGGPSSPDAPRSVPSGGAEGATTPSSATSAPHNSPQGSTPASADGTPRGLDGSTAPAGATGSGDANSPTRYGGPAKKYRREPWETPADYDGPMPDKVPAADKVTVSDPIDVATGDMVLDQVDLQLPALLPLVLERVHVSSYRAGRWFGPSWASTVDQRIQLNEDRILFFAADGMGLTYPVPTGGDPVFPDAGPRWPLARAEDGTWTVHDPRADRTLHFAARAEGVRVLPLTAVTNRSGQRIDIDRDEHGVPEFVRHSGGYRVGIDTRDGRITGLRLVSEGTPDIFIARYSYDNGNLVEVMNSSGRSLRFAYDEVGRIVRWENRLGMWYEFSYDADGRCVRNTGAGGYLSATFSYDRDRLLTEYTNSLGHTTVFHLDSENRVRQVVDPQGRASIFEYGPHGRLVSSGDPLGNATRREYDDLGALLAVSYADGTRTRFGYDDQRRLAVITQPDGQVLRYEYAANGSLAATVDPAGARTSYAYEESGRLTITGALGTTVTVETNRAGLPLVVTDGGGSAIRYAYDVFGRAHTIVDALGGTTRFSWLVEGSPLSATAPDGTTRQWNYDSERVVRERVDELGRVTRIETGHFDLPVVETKPDGTRLAYTYDTELQLTTVTDQEGRSWRYGYDSVGNLVWEKDFNGREVHYRYDAAKRLAERVNAVGQRTLITRDSVGRVVRREVGDVVTTFEHDGMGRILRARNADADVVYVYDPAGRVLSETCNGRAVSSRYDLAGRRTHRFTPTGAESRWDYDEAHRPITLHTAGETIRFTHDSVGREIERRIGDSVLLAQTWNAGSRLTSQTLLTGIADAAGVPPRPTVSQRRDYTYRRDNVLSGVDDLLAGSRQFGLDLAGQVTSVEWTAAGVSERYVYDRAGTVTHAGLSTGAPGNAGGDSAGPRTFSGTLVTQAGAVRYEYDAEGRVTLRHHQHPVKTVDTWRYQWDGEDRLVAVSTPDGQRWHYRYDAFGRRIAKERVSSDGQTVVERTLFAWDGDTLAEQVHESPADRGGAALVWDWEPGSYRAVTQTHRNRLRDASQAWIDEEFYAIVTDSAGTPSELVDPRGNLGWRKQSTLWGLPLPEPAHRTTTPLRFPGQYYDPETHLHFNLHRYYDPAIAQYLTHDPLGLAPGPNSRFYVGNPNTWTDPLGLAPFDPYTQGRADGQTVFSGHGHITGDDASTVTVPDGTTLHFYATHKQAISDHLGNAIEVGAPAKPIASFGPGEAVPDYFLSKPDNLVVMGNPTKVDAPTRLSELLKPGMGDAHWAACRSEAWAYP